MLGRGLLDRYPPEMTEIGYLASRRHGFAPSVASFFRALITPARVRPDVPVPVAELASLRAPTLLIWGDQDVFMTPDAAAESIAAIPDGTLIRVHGGHAPWLNNPERSGPAVATFLKAT